MNALMHRLQQRLGPHAGVWRALGVPVFVVLVLAMMVLPLPPFALDLLFTFNIALALMVVMISAHMVKPLDFAAFPTVLLITTLMRLSLNVASTRVVLVDGHSGPAAAGKVIEAFGHFLIGGNFAVGLIVFAILVVINFIVVTKGAERIAARWADHRKVPQIAFKPDWTKHAKAAPFKRNDQMLAVLPIGVIIFPGTGIQDNLADKARKMGIPVYRFGKGGA